MKDTNKGLKEKEKLEIKEDVKDAFDKALNKKKLTHIDEINETLNQEEIDKLLKNNKREINSKMPLIVTAILLVIIMIIGLYIFFSNNPKTIFEKTIQVSFKNIEALLPTSSLEKGSISFINETNQFQCNYEIDENNNVLNTKIINNKDTLNLYSQNDKTYIYSSSIYNKYIELDDIKIPSTEQTKIILDAIEKALKNGIALEKFNGSQIQLKVNEKIKKVYKSSLTIDKNNMNNILDNIKESLNSNDKLIETLSDISNLNKTDIESEIITRINNYKKQIENIQEITIDIYTEGPTYKFVKMEIIKTEQNQKRNIIVNKENEQYTVVTSSGLNMQITPSENKTIVKGIRKNGTKFNMKITKNKLNKIERQKITDSIKFSELNDIEKTNINSKLFINPLQAN